MHGEREFRRERELLVVCARGAVRPEARENAVAMARDVGDWGYVIDEANRQRILPWLYVALPGASMPSDARVRLHDLYSVNSRRNLILTAETLRIIASLREAGIRCAPYKGPILSQYLHGRLDMRQCADVDVFVPADDVATAARALENAGYLPCDRLNSGQLRAVLASQSEWQFRGPSSVLVELQWRATPNFLCTGEVAAGIWDRLVSYRVGGYVVQMLSVEDQVLMLCLHGAKHCWEKLAWVVDIAALIRTPDSLDWAALTRRAGEAGRKRILLLGLWLASELGGAELPAEVLRDLSDDPVVEEAGKRIVQTVIFERPMRSRDWMKFQLLLMESFGQRCTSLSRLLVSLTAADCAHELPDKLQWAYYFIRAGRLFRKYCLP